MILFKTLVGSKAFGTHTEGSDSDFASVVMPPIDGMLGLGYKETIVSTSETEDNTTHTFQKFIELAAKANPSILDILFSSPEHWVEFKPLWFRLYDRRHIFLSKIVADTYVGYARSQLKRIRTHREWLLNPPKEKPSRESFGLPGHSTIPKEHREAVISIPQKYLAPEIQDLARAEKGFEMAMRGWTQYENWKKTRNPDRAELEAKYGYDTKHAMHMYRLLRQGKEILATGDLTVDRRNIDADRLKEVRQGALTYDDLMVEVATMREEIETAKRESKLSDRPDRSVINALCVEIMKEYLETFS